MKLLIEAFVVGIVMVVVGAIVKNVNFQWKTYNTEITLFLTGVFAHLLFEFTGFNKWYCKNGFACKR
jgi:uncharacterized membrane protein HdeD (DUF308 family)